MFLTWYSALLARPCNKKGLKASKYNINLSPRPNIKRETQLNVNGYLGWLKSLFIFIMDK